MVNGYEVNNFINLVFDINEIAESFDDLNPIIYVNFEFYDDDRLLRPLAISVYSLEGSNISFEYKDTDVIFSYFHMFFNRSPEEMTEFIKYLTLEFLLRFIFMGGILRITH